jgi:uncharacterized protein YpmB
MDRIIEFVKEKKLMIIFIVIIIIIFIVITNATKKKGEAEETASPEINNSWGINSVEESTKDPFADQYQTEDIEEDREF